MTSVVALVTHREGEEDIWRVALDMNPRMTEARIDDFIDKPTDMGRLEDYKRLVQRLIIRAACASDGTPFTHLLSPMTNDEKCRRRRNGSLV